jgi:hypothetical protein
MATSNCGGLFPLEREIVRSITIGKDECHIVEFLHRNIFDILVHLGDVHTHALDGATSATAIGAEKKISFKTNPTRIAATIVIA